MNRNNVTVLAAVALVLSGCDLRLSPEEKINAAFPQLEAVTNAKTAVLEMAGPAKLKEIEAQLASKMKIRALNCAKGYDPSWYSTVGLVREKIQASTCFNEADNDMARWLGIQRVGLTLAAPATAATAKGKAPDFIVTEGQIQWVRFASRANVAFVDAGTDFEVYNTETGRLMHKESKGATYMGRISPDGRMFTAGDNGKLRIKSAVNGTVLLELAGVSATAFHWLDNRTAVYTGSSSGSKSFFIDFTTGAEVPVRAFDRDSITMATPVKDEPDNYVLFSSNRVAKVSLSRSREKPEVRLLAEKTPQAMGQSYSMGWALGNAFLTPDNATAISYIGNLLVVSLVTLEPEQISFAPWRVQSMTPTSDPDAFILTGSTPGPGNEIDSRRAYLFSMANRTLTLIEREKFSGQQVNYARYDFMPNTKQVVVHSGNQIETPGKIPTLDVVHLSTFTQDLQKVANQIKIEMAEREERYAKEAMSERERERERTLRLLGVPASPYGRPAPAPSGGSYGGSSNAGIAAELRELYLRKEKKERR